ncbi:uncharacterized protein [Triticum aestivum]|uniref:uncharacterized protein n=1 Tax=Triticum aestivum TaxID=4565 RepID=UPI001D019F19|nr:uncharacterized protein LOC123068256 [Triticum aestivum]
MDPPEKQPPAAAASTASPSRGSAGAPPPLGRQHPQPSPDPDSVAATWEVGTSTTTTTPESIFAMESVRAMENKSCPQSDGPVKLSFKLLKEITNNFNHKLGFGASAEVYKGEFNGEVIAVKVLPFKIGVDEMLFQNEYEHLKRLKHPNIVRLVGFCDETERVRAEYKGEMVMAEEIHRALCLEFLPNGPLSNNLHEKHLRLDWHRRFQIIKGMCAGLEYIHGACVVHLDIKTDNVLLDAKMIPKIVDFGISRLLGEECIRESNATQLGTVGYVPPEFIDNRVISRGFDIFSVGVTIKKLLTGGMNYWNISYMNDKDCIEHVHNNWRKKFQEIPSYPSLEVDCEQVRTCIRTALQCMDDERLNRPSMKDINSELIERQMMTACSKECSESVQFPAKSRVRRKAFRKVQREATPLLREKTVRLKRNSWALDIQGKRGPISRRRERNYMCSDLKDDSRLTIDIPEMPSPEFEFLREITNDFSKERIVSECASATVFKGILNSGEETLVKRFQGSKISYNVFQSEVGQLMEIKHKNIVRLLGYCNVKKREVVKHDGRYILTSKVESFLWYEYLSNKSLDEYIYGDSCQFDWNMRFKIILAICEALHFLHIELNRPISHLPLTPENIFLDKNMVPKLADIGLSDLFDGLSLEGTEYDLEINRYKAPEYINRYTTSFQSDIYNLGLLIMDTATGEKHSSCQETMDSSHFVNVHQKWTDEYIATKYASLDVTCIGQLKVCLHTALWCVKEKRKDRPSIREIVSTLNIPYLDTPLNKPGAGPILLLSVQPQRLSFPLIPARLTSRPLCLTNNKDECVGFRLLTDNPARYHTELPLCGFVPPKCTYTINVIVREHTKELPSNSDEFLTLLTIRMQESDFKNLDPDSVAVLFENADHEVREMMLPVVCDPPEETTADQIIASKNCRVVLSIDVHPTSQNYRQVLSLDVHPTVPWMLTTNQRGTICIWNYRKMETVSSFEVSPGKPVYSAKFIAQEQWLVTGDGDGYIHVYNYGRMEEVRNFKAHENNIMSMAVSPTFSLVLSASDDHLIKLWDWDKGWECTQTFRGHCNRVTQVMFHPRYTYCFASASLDGRVKIWNIKYDNCKRKFNEHPDGLLCLQYFADVQPNSRRHLLVVGSSDGVAKVWDPEAESCVGTLEGRHTNRLTALCWHPKHEVLVTGSLDGTIQIWKPTNTTYRLENIIGLNIGGVTALAHIPESTRVVVACEQGIAMVEIDYP